MPEYVWGTSDPVLFARVFKYLQQTWSVVGRVELSMRKNEGTGCTEVYAICDLPVTLSVIALVANAFTSGWEARRP